MARIDPQINIRLPAELLQRVAADATANKRSTTAEIVARLEGGAMSLRDYFAGQAITGLLAMGATEASLQMAQENNTTLTGLRAMQAYDVADAMLAERSK